MNNILLFLVLGLTFVISLSQIIILLTQSEKQQEETKPIEDIPTTPEEEKIDYEKINEKTSQILQDAVTKANKIVSNAELKSLGLVAQEKIDLAKLNEQYLQIIAGLEQKIQSNLNVAFEKTQNSYNQFIESLEQKIIHQEEANRKILDQKMNKMVENSQNALTAFITDVNAQISSQISKELHAVREEIENYKKQRMKIIDEYLIDILERTLEETLGKKLTLAEHSEIIFNALEKAKGENLIS